MASIAFISFFACFGRWGRRGLALSLIHISNEVLQFARADEVLQLTLLSQNTSKAEPPSGFARFLPSLAVSYTHLPEGYGREVVFNPLKMREDGYYEMESRDWSSDVCSSDLNLFEIYYHFYNV